MFDFFVSPSVFTPLRDISFKYMAKLIEFAKTNKKKDKKKKKKKCTQNLKRCHVH